MDESWGLLAPFVSLGVTKKAANIKQFPITDKTLKKQITDALAGNGPLPNLTRQQRKSLINHYKQFQISNASIKEEAAQALNWARIRYLEGKGPVPRGTNKPLYDFVDAFRKSR